MITRSMVESHRKSAVSQPMTLVTPVSRQNRSQLTPNEKLSVSQRRGRRAKEEEAWMEDIGASTELISVS